MYEPKYLPQLTEESISLPQFRFAIHHSTKCHGFNDPKSDPLHIHRELEIFFNISCDASFLMNGYTYPVAKGDMIISRPGDVHMAIFHKTTIQEHICLWIDADFNSPPFAFLNKENFSPLISFNTQTKKDLQSLFISLWEACNNGGHELAKISYLLQIFTIIEEKDTNLPQHSLIPESLQKIVTDIQQNYSTIHNVNDIANTHFVSSATLTRWFRKYIHSSPRDYLESVRLSNALKLLNEGSSVTNACMQSGFSDCSHFIALFKKKFGETPLQYKNKGRID